MVVEVHTEVVVHLVSKSLRFWGNKAEVFFILGGGGGRGGYGGGGGGGSYGGGSSGRW